MALHITNPKADRLARKVAKQQGRTVTDAIIHALEAQVETDGVRQKADRTRRKAEVLAILAEIDKLPVLDDRSPDEILGYDENGLPT